MSHYSLLFAVISIHLLISGEREMYIRRLTLHSLDIEILAPTLDPSKPVLIVHLILTTHQGFLQQDVRPSFGENYFRLDISERLREWLGSFLMRRTLCDGNDVDFHKTVVRPNCNSPAHRKS